MYGMKKTTVYLPEDLDKALKWAAGAQRRSEAEIIREAIKKSLDSMQPPLPRLPLFRSEDATLAERVDEELHGFGE
jgi:Arc/MetJ-type ribon-helix-helix transcriptional regulator